MKNWITSAKRGAELMMDLRAIKNRSTKQILAELKKPLTQEEKQRLDFRRNNLSLNGTEEGKLLAKKLKAAALGISVKDLDQMTFENFKTDRLDEQNLKLYRMVRNWRIEKEDHGIFLFGNPGIGKTHLLTALMSSQLSRTTQTRVIHWTAMTSDLKANWSLRHHYVDMALKSEIVRVASTGVNTARNCGKVNAIFIDEIGFGDEKSWSQEFFLELIDAIQSAGIKCFGTSNLELEEFRKKFDSRVVDRMKKLGVFLSFENVSYRKLAYQRNLAKFRDVMEDL